MTKLIIGQIIQAKRKVKQMTQAELASKMGVTKSSVSKWETGQTYPDIYLLPELATHFNMTVDELLGYSPQLTKAEISAHYQRLAEAYALQPFIDVYQECQLLIKKYAACSPFLLQMAVLLLNHADRATENVTQVDVYQQVIDLSQRIKQESDDHYLISQANVIEAGCYIQQGEFQTSLDLLGGTVQPYLGEEQLLAAAHAGLGDVGKATELLQASMYQSLLSLIAVSGTYLTYTGADQLKFDELVKRITHLVESYQVKSLHPMIYLTFQLSVFIGLCQQSRLEEALVLFGEMLDLLDQVDYPIKLHGDWYFDQIDDWIADQLALNSHSPRNDKLIKESLLSFFKCNPLVNQSFAGNQTFAAQLQLLERKLGV